LRESTNKLVQAKQSAATSKYCINSSLSYLMRTADLNDVFQNKAEITDTTVTSEETKEAKPSERRVKALRQESRKEQMSKNLKDKNGQILVEKMRNLKVGQEDLLKMTDVKLNIMERLVQVAGHFYRYDQ